jgi:hypothetical protein
MWGCTLVIPAVWEVEVAGSQSEDGWDKSLRPYLKKKERAKRAGGIIKLEKILLFWGPEHTECS